MERARAAGLAVETFFCDDSGRSLAAWERDQRRLTRWLARLAKPVGIMACSDRLGTRVLDACRIPPVGVATRRSTEVAAIEDAVVARAARLIRERACEGRRPSSCRAPPRVWPSSESSR